MKTSFILHKGEQIVYQTHRKRALFNILGSILLTAVFFILFAVGAGFGRQWGYNISLYADLMILLVLFVGVQDVISMIISEVSLTNQRVLVRGIPNAWSRREIPIDEASLSQWIRGVLIRRNNRVLVRAVIPDRTDFMNAFDDLIKKHNGRGTSETNGKGVVEQLEKLEAMHASGKITKGEYEKAKDKLLS